MAGRASLAASIAFALSACAGSASMPAATYANAPVADVEQSLPERFVLTIADPPLQVRVAGDGVVLAGPHGQRRFAVVRNEALFDGRSVMALDPDGELELRVTERLCIDSISGAQFPYTGRLVLDGAAPLTGCGEPTRGAGEAARE